MKKFIDNLTLSNFIKYAAITFLAAFAIRILLPVQVRSFVVIVAFIFILNTVLAILEEENATKRAMKKAWLLFIGICAFIGIRLVVGHILNMPLITSYNELNGIGIMGLPAQNNIPISILLELLFIFPALGIVLGLIKGGKKTRSVIYCLAVLIFAGTIWQVKQGNHALSVKNSLQASIDQNEAKNKTAVMEKEADTSIRVAIATEDIKIGNLVVKKATKMAIIDEKSFSPLRWAEPTVDVVLEDKDGNFVGNSVTVPMRKIQILSQYKDSAPVFFERPRDVEPLRIVVTPEYTKLLRVYNGDIFRYETPPDSRCVFMVKFDRTGKEFYHNPSLEKGETRRFPFYGIGPEGEEISVKTTTQDIEQFELKYQIVAGGGV